jgi:hypothetical protein
MRSWIILGERKTNNESELIQSYILLSIHRCMIELVLLILISFTNGTGIDENDDDWLPEIEDDPNCIHDWYGPGPLDDLLGRGHLECASDKCLQSGYDYYYNFTRCDY